MVMWTSLMHMLWFVALVLAGPTSVPLDADSSGEDLDVQVITALGSPPHTPQALDKTINDCLPNAFQSEEVFQIFPADNSGLKDTISASPLSEATTVPDGRRFRRGRDASSGSQSSQRLERSSAALERECEDLKEQLQLARERLARLHRVLVLMQERDPKDIREQTIDHLQKKLRSERESAETARQELIQEFAKEREQLTRELNQERSRRQHYQQLVEAQRASDAEVVTKAVRVVQPPSNRSSSASSRFEQAAVRQPSLPTPSSAAAILIPACGRRDVYISRPSIRLRSRSPSLQVDASPSRVAADTLLSPMRLSSSSSQLRIATPGRKASPLTCSSRSISRGPTRVMGASLPLPQPCIVQPSTIVYKHSPPTATNLTRSMPRN